MTLCQPSISHLSMSLASLRENLTVFFVFGVKWKIVREPAANDVPDRSSGGFHFPSSSCPARALRIICDFVSSVLTDLPTTFLSLYLCQINNSCIYAHRPCSTKIPSDSKTIGALQLLLCRKSSAKKAISGGGIRSLFHFLPERRHCLKSRISRRSL